ncbi:transmembrane signal receptor [Lithospermum erythrorhizon]|uniref:Transmembrane signal receptor n=1 Tax=Lithospermum erythrorhizon TaxID=34254 RepID=A0AAV3Q4R0_LITER
MHDPTAANLCAVNRILRYLAGTIHQGISITTAPSFGISAYSDSDWAGCPRTRRSTSGYCVLFSGNLVSWSSKKQPTVACSSTEAEYRALASVAAEITWLQMLLKDLHISLSHAPVALCDNISVPLGDLKVQHVPTQLQLADIFTKALPSSKFKAALSNLCLPHQAQLERGCKPIPAGRAAVSKITAEQSNKTH